MSKAISYDLRVRARDLITIKKYSITEVARTLDISRSSLYRWLKNPSLKEQPRKGKPVSFKRTVELKMMVLNNPCVTGLALAVHSEM